MINVELNDTYTAAEARAICKAYEKWKRSDFLNLDNAYKGPYSDEKRHAASLITTECAALGGFWLKYFSANTFNFSAGYIYENKGSAVFVYYTRSNRRAALVSDIVEWLKAHE